jgi:hypothetical protein
VHIDPVRRRGIDDDRERDALAAGDHGRRDDQRLVDLAGLTAVAPGIHTAEQTRRHQRDLNESGFV